VALLAALALTAPPAALAAPAAVDEYSLGPVGTRVSERESPDPLPVAQESDPEVRAVPGVVGETTPVEGPLAAVGSIASPLVWALAALLALAAAAILLPRRPAGAAR
jgi:hypothetical protein